MPDAPKVPRPREAAVQRTLVRVALVQFGVVLWRNNSGAARMRNATGKTRLLRAGLGKGSSDLIGLLPPSGRFFALEVKRPGEVPTAEQRAWLDVVRERGGVGCWANDAWMLEAILRRMLEPGGYQLTVRVNADSSQDIISRWTGEVLR